MMDMHFCHLTSQCFETERNIGILCVRLIFESNGSDYIFQDETRHAISSVKLAVNLLQQKMVKLAVNLLQ